MLRLDTDSRKPPLPPAALSPRAARSQLSAATLDSAASSKAASSSSASAALSPTAPATARPALAQTSLEKFRSAESAFLSPTAASPSDSPKPGRNRAKRRTAAAKEDAMRELMGDDPAAAAGGGGRMLGALPGGGGDDDPQSSASASSQPSPPSSSTFPPLSPTGGSNGGSHVLRDRRPSFMQPTQQELQRQAELREAHAVAAAKKAADVAKSTRRAHGQTSTDLYLQQQAEIAARRAKELEALESERKEQRARFLAKHDPASLSPAAANGRPLLSHQGSIASGAQSARTAGSTFAPINLSTASSVPAPVLTASSAAAIAREIQKREGQIARDSRRAPAPDEAGGGDDDYSEEDDDFSDGADALAAPSAAPSRPSHKAPHSSALTFADDDENEDDDLGELRPSPARSRPLPSSVASLYDPSARTQARHDGGHGGPTGLDLLMQSTRLKKKIRKAERRPPPGQISNASFARMTEAQIERSLDTLAAKKQLERDRDGGTRDREKERVREANANETRDAKKPASFFPSLWKKITGS